MLSITINMPLLTLSQSESILAHSRVIIPTGEQDPTDELIAAMQGVLQSNDLDAWAPVAIGLYNIINLPSNRRFDTRVPASGIAGEHDQERRNL